MTRKEIEELVNERNKELSIPYAPQDPFKRCKNFLEQNPYNSINDFLEIDVWEMINCIYTIENPQNIRETDNLISLTKDFLEGRKIDDISAIMKNLTLLYSEEVLPITIDYLQSTEYFEERKILKELKEFLYKKVEEKKYDEQVLQAIEEALGNGKLSKLIAHGNGMAKEAIREDFMKKATNIIYEELKEKMDDLKEKISKDNIKNLIALINLIIIDIDTISDGIILKLTQQEMILDTEDIRKKIESIEKKYGRKLRQKDKDKEIYKYQKGIYKLDDIKAQYNRIKKYVQEELNKMRKAQKASNKEIAGYKTALASLDRALTQEEIRNPQSIINTVTSEEIKKAILKLIYEHNMKYYIGLEEELTELSKNTKNHYIALLNDFNIKISESDLHKIMINKVADLKTILTIITMIGIDENIVEILKNTNINIANRIKDLMENSYVSKVYIINNPDIFMKESKKLDKLENGILIINSYNINPGIFSSHPEILVDNQENLVRNLEILKSYNLLKSLKKATDFTFLTKSNIEDKIDKFLELGYEKFLEEDINLLNANNIKRLEVLKVLNMEAQSKEELERVLTSDKFFVKDDLITEYIPNIVKYKEHINISNIDLSSFRKTSRTYEIGSSLFSIKKIQRLLSAENDLYTSLFYNVNLTEEEYNSVLKALDCYETKK